MNPVTGTPEISFMSLDEELALGERAAEKLEAELGLIDDPVVTEYVQRIGARLAAESPRQDVTYTFKVLDLEFPNAFALPGGHVYVSRGLLALVNAESELANVLGHEIGHIAARHAASGAWRRSTIGVLSGIGEVATALVGLGGLPSAAGKRILAAHSRGQESQADDFGQELAARAGFDPAAMSRFLHSLDRDDTVREKAVRETSFLDSHPVTEERVETTRARARELGWRVAVNPVRDRAAYLERIQGLVVGQDPRSGLFLNDRVFVHPELDIYVQFPEGWLSVNGPSWVKASEGPVEIELRLQGPGDDPALAAQSFLEAERRRSEGAEDEASAPLVLTPRVAERRRLGDAPPAYFVEGIAPGELTVLLYWVPLPNGIFRLKCTMPTALQSGHVDECRATARSLRPLRAQERGRVRRVTLRFEKARAGETLGEFCARTRNHWSVEWTAVVNGLTRPYQLHAGQLVKYARAEPYRSSVRALTAEIDRSADPASSTAD